MAWGFHIFWKATAEPRTGRRPTAYYASRAVPAKSVATLLPNRRGLWFALSLAGCSAAVCLMTIVYLATNPERDVATVPVPGALQPMPAGRTTTFAMSVPDLGPLTTGSIGQPSAGPAIRQTLTEPGSAGTGRAFPDLRTAGFGPQTALGRATTALPTHGAPGGNPLPLAKSDAPIRLAGLGDSATVTILHKRPPVLAARPQIQHTVVVAEGDTLSRILDNYSVPPGEARALVAALARVFPPSRLRAGQELVLTMREASEGTMLPLALGLVIDGKDILVKRDGPGRFSASGSATLTTGPQQHRAVASISGSLYGTARSQNVPDSIIVRMMRTHSYDVDFQREIRKGDTFEMFYISKDSEIASSGAGTLLFSSLSTKGKTGSYYRFTTADGETDYFDAEGVSSRKPLMKTPINGARISSRFGMRRHPISGYTKLHAGIDFAAPTGTPVLAAGDGVVDFSGRHGGYGKYIRLKHDNKVKTAYAHLSRYAKGIKPGKRVRQGQIIGFVGSTGRSTGPHLHYEVHVGGKKKNPLKVKIAGTGRRLNGKELAAFVKERERIDQLRRSLPSTTRVAAAKP